MTDIEVFKLDVRKFDNIETEIKSITKQMKPYQDKIKELKQQKQELQTTICGFMQTNEIGECKLQEGSLLFKESKGVVPLTKNSIKDNIFKFFQTESNKTEFKNANNEEKANLLFTYVYENREFKEKSSLKRVSD
jgi:hypothetical protein